MARPEFIWVVVYDIEQASSRRQAKEILRFAGSMVRPCVYEIPATETGIRRIADKLSVYLLPEDRVRIYRLCETCRDGSLIFGEGDLAERPKVLVI